MKRLAILFLLLAAVPRAAAAEEQNSIRHFFSELFKDTEAVLAMKGEERKSLREVLDEAFRWTLK